MTPVALNDLPRWSHWPARLLGASSWTVPTRTLEKIEQEYDLDKYARCLAYVEREPDATPQMVKWFEIDLAPDHEGCLSFGDDLYQTTRRDAQTRYEKLLVDTLRPEVEGSPTVVELGAGYGYNLSILAEQFPSHRFVGGEYSQNGVEVARRMKLDVRPFNYYDLASYSWLNELEPPLLVFTSHSMEQLPSGSTFMNRWVKTPEFDSSVRSGKTPIGGDPSVITVGLP